MNKNNLVILIVTSIICLLPICLAIAVYDDLPEKVVMQWNFVQNPNWYAHKAVAAFGMPVFFMVINIFVNFFMLTDPKRENASKAIRIFTQWFISFLSLILVPLQLLMNLGADIPLLMIILVLIGILSIFMGNYLPKNRQNYSIGIKVPWTLNDPENWNKTHRLAGIIWIIGGILFIITAFLPLENITGIIVICSIISMLVIVPIIYSYCLYKKS